MLHELKKKERTKKHVRTSDTLEWDEEGKALLSQLYGYLSFQTLKWRQLTEV